MERLSVGQLLVVISNCIREGNEELKEEALKALASKNGDYRKELKKMEKRITN